MSDSGFGTARVPRRATFDDLRVGQWVCLADILERGVIGSGWVGQLSSQATDNEWNVRVASLAPVVQVIAREDCERGRVTILHDAPAPPVTVRREDYATLRAAVASWAGVEANAHARDILGAARALIDNADTGADA